MIEASIFGTLGAVAGVGTPLARVEGILSRVGGASNRADSSGIRLRFRAELAMSAFPIDGKNVKLLRENKGLTQAELAKKIGGDCSFKTISRIETNDTCSLEMAGAIATVLGVTMAELRRQDDPPAPTAPPRPTPEAPDLRDVVALLERRQSVHILLAAGVQPGVVIAQLVQLVPMLAVIDFEKPVTFSRPGLLGEIVRVFDGKAAIPAQKPDDFVAFGRHMEALRGVRLLAITHFDRIKEARLRDEYEPDLFHALRYYTMTERKLVLVLVGRKPFGELLPPDHELSDIDLKTIELRPIS